MNEYSRFIELRGGLGDIVYGLYDSPHYSSLETLGPEEQVLVAILCSNPGVKELFLWHPKNKQFHIRDLGYIDPWGVEPRRKYGLPDNPTSRDAFSYGEVIYYPSPSDIDVLSANIRKPYIVFALAAGLDWRNVPQDMAEEAASIVRRYGFNVIVVGRTYDNWNQWGDHRFINTRNEYHLNNKHAIDLIDKLSFPGTARLVEGSSGVFCCESCIMHLAWRLKKPCFTIVSENQTEWKDGTWIAWGKNLPGSGYRKIKEFTPRDLEMWLMTRVLYENR